jgi:hypothetical protein
LADELRKIIVQVFTGEKGSSPKRAARKLA